MQVMDLYGYLAGVIVLIMMWVVVEAIHYNRKINKLKDK